MKIIVPVLNRFDLLRRMVESIDIEATVYVINNTGCRQDFEHSNELIKMHWVDLPYNLGVASSWNLGIKMLPFEKRWVFSSADSYFAPGVCQELAEASSDAITLCGTFPFWQTFAVGEKVVERVGLFDEALHPAYFEDTDYQRRCEQAGIDFRVLVGEVFHDNSSTIKSDEYIASRNVVSFQSNEDYYSKKMFRQDFGAGEWSLLRRRHNSWDKE